jgi:hypothetical protein
MTLLERHVPLSLLLDLALPGAPPSLEILTLEGGPEEAGWEPVRRASA